MLRFGVNCIYEGFLSTGGGEGIVAEFHEVGPLDENVVDVVVKRTGSTGGWG